MEPSSPGPTSSADGISPDERWAAEMAAARPDLRDPVLIRALAHLSRTVTRDVPPTIGRYRVDALIGSGGFGHVFRGFDPALGRAVAIKISRSGRSVGARFVDEAQTLAQLNHPNVVAIFDVGQTPEPTSQGYLVMALVEGESLAAWLGRKPSVTQILDAFRGAALGLAAAHALGVVHRDVKPANILIDEHGVAKVVDFGIARALGETTTRTGPTTPGESHETEPPGSGTPRYVAPEQRAGAEPDVRADVFSFSVSLYESIFEALPSWAEDGRVQIPASPPIPAPVMRALTSGLFRDPARRAAELDEWIDALTPRRRRARTLAAVALTAITVLGLVFAFSRDRATPPPSDPAPATERTPEVAGLASVDRSLDALDFTSARREIDALLAAADEHTPQRGAILLRRGALEQSLGYERAAESTLQHALDLAEAGDDPATSARASISLAFSAGVLRRDRAAAEIHLQHADAAIARAGRPCELEVLRVDRRAEIARALGDVDEALAGATAAEVLAGACAATTATQRRQIQLSLGWSLYDRGLPVLAEARWTVLVDQLERVWGASSPQLIGVLTNRAAGRIDRRDPEAALADLRRIEQIVERAGIDRGHADAALGNLGMLLAHRVAPSEGLPRLEEVLARRIERGAHPARIAQARLRVANVALGAGELDRSLRESLAAVAEFQAIHGDKHRDVAFARASVAATYSHMRDETRAVEENRRIWDDFVGVIDERHAFMINLAISIANGEMRLRHAAEAERWAARARANASAAGLDDAWAPSLDVLDSALALERDDRREAIGLARRAAARYAADDASYDAKSARTWLAALESTQSNEEIRATRDEFSASR